MKLKFSIPLILLIVFAGYYFDYHSITEGLFVLGAGLVGGGLAELLVKKLAKRKD